MRLGVAKALVDGELVNGDVEVVDGRVAAVGLGAPSGSKIAAPGFVDLQVNGYAGVDFSAPGRTVTRGRARRSFATASPRSSRRSSARRWRR